ncbi:XrtN system VIT domain-containing protein [Rufibacter quisquiliarum]|uniref:XrtN system VIT domain protein n=1 Tax=Rufibacter quisquiliarum TaxID=1549639 RepID=A0A839GRP5_9BACT|nr:XrtN system VIT domain-containing protein [Rufibacter quisquiliarum]MBA9077516.1 XrtN system VIT domain protein [Rufibacter quisquiliarum]
MNFEIQSTLKATTAESPRQLLRRKPLLVAGMVLIIISFGVFLGQEWSLQHQGQGHEGIFMLNYVIAAGFLLTLLFHKMFRFRQPLAYLDYLMLFLVMGLISDFALNREITIFLPSVGWFSGWLVLVAVAMVGYSFRFLLPRVVQLVVLFLLGTGLVLFSYFALYLIPFYPLGLLGAIALGLGLHVFIPLCAVICLAVAARRMYRGDVALKRTFLAGIILPVLLSLVFLVLWQRANRHIHQILNAYQLQDRQDLPRWVVLSQQLPVSPLYARMLQTDLVYQAASEHFSPFSLPDQRFNELLRHDPLVVVATRFFDKPDLTVAERIKILESMYDARHPAQERLWSGQHLTTDHVITQAQIFPEYRLSYTEKILSVRNHHPSTWGQEEAIYTFHLPEGSVVTSLSLWINGKEEKGYLTTKSKADSAYTTIVGVEVRDPSVVHWQEGNTVSVRVFPCTPQENRRFKLGVTSPLRQKGEQLVYQNIYFDGPAAAAATETTEIRMADATAAHHLPADFKPQGSGRFARFGSYVPDWHLAFPAPALSPATFTFAGHTYQMQARPHEFEAFSPTRIYLDLNKAWSAEEVALVWAQVKEQKVYTSLHGTMVRLTAENKDDVVAQLRNYNFTLFPFHHIKEPDRALVISKSNGLSPNLQDLQESRFAADFKKIAYKQQPLRFYNLGSEVTPYVKTLKELQLLQYHEGSARDLAKLLTAKRFVRRSRRSMGENTVVLGEAGTEIIRTPATGTAAGSGTDHLMRLFAYNHLLQQIGGRYFQKDFLEESLINEAAQANVVSPLSSLVVLETKQDYERFGIEESKNSLGNASVASAGAVPEPHEWLLIFLVVAVVAWSVLKPKLLP